MVNLNASHRKHFPLRFKLKADASLATLVASISEFVANTGNDAPRSGVVQFAPHENVERIEETLSQHLELYILDWESGLTEEPSKKNFRPESQSLGNHHGQYGAHDLQSNVFRLADSEENAKIKATHLEKLRGCLLGVGGGSVVLDRDSSILAFLLGMDSNEPSASPFLNWGGREGFTFI